MFRDFFRAFSDLFTERRNRIEVSGLLVTMALLPVSELVVTRMFSHLIISGPERYDRDPDGVILSGAVFFLAFALSRAIHHVVRLNRVRVFRRGFESSGQQRPASKEAWSWAAAFELSTAMVSLIQLVAFCGLFIWLDVLFGLANLLIAAGVLWLIAAIYARQLKHQVAYLVEGNKPGSTAIGERVGNRVRDAELGAVVASLAMALSLAAVLFRALDGHIAGADAIVLFIGLRMMYSQVGNLSASAMRFARVKARLTAGEGVVDVMDPDEEFDPLDDELEDAGELQPARPTAHRAQLVSQMMLAGQRGELEQVQRFGERLSATAVPMETEVAAQQAAEAFAVLAASTEDAQHPVSLLWWARPFPGAVGNWLSPLLLRSVSGRPVLFQTPAAAAQDPHLVMIGSVAGSAHRHAIVAGTGALGPEVTLDPKATFVSVRGPLTADRVRAAGGPEVTSYGDPTVLASRFLPVEQGPSNGRLAFVRHVSHADVHVSLSGRMDELDPMASRPEDIERFLADLTSYDGVVTSDFSTAVLCHSYGVPCAPVSFADHETLGFVFDDYARGVGLSDFAPTVVDPRLDRTTWDDLLVPRTADDATLDRVQAAIEQAVTLYSERVEQV